VNVVFGGLGKVIVDHASDGINVESPGRHIGGHKNPGLAGAELGKNPVPLRLTLVSVKGIAREAFCEKLVRQIFRPSFCSREDECLTFGRLRFGEDRFEQSPLLGSVADGHNLLVNGDRRGAGRLKTDQDGILLVGFCQHLDAGRKGRRKQECLTLGMKGLEDCLHIGKESHVEHPVGLIENNRVDMGEVDGPPLHVVNEASGGGNHQIPGSAKKIDLASHVRSSDEKNGAAPEIFSVFPSGALDLPCQLPGRGEDEDLVACTVSLGALVPVEGGKKKSSGLAGTGLGHSEYIPSLDDRRNGLFLDGGGGFVFEVGKSAQKIRIEAKGLK
jgi:hypothetical protein